MEQVRLAVQAAGPVRTEEYMGRSYRVVPAVLVKSQVLHNNLGRTFLPAEDITESWAEASNDAPVVLDHPTSRGMPISARSNDVLNARGLGRLYHVHVENGAIKGDVYLDPARAAQIPDLGVILSALDAGRPTELSTGFPVAVETLGGVHNGLEYDLTIHPTGPLDHLAVFADKTGACSIKDGCGLGINHAGECQVTNAPTPEVVVPGEPEPAAISEPAANAGDQSQEGSDMDRTQMIAHLAEKGPLDGEALNKLSDCQLKALMGVGQPAPAGAANAEGDSAAWRIAHEYREKFETLEAKAANALAREEEERARMLDDLIYNARHIQYSQDELEAMDFVALKKLHGSVIVPRADYSGRGGPRASNSGPSFDFVRGVMDGPRGSSVLDKEN